MRDGRSGRQVSRQDLRSPAVLDEQPSHARAKDGGVQVADQAARDPDEGTAVDFPAVQGDEGDYVALVLFKSRDDQVGLCPQVCAMRSPSAVTPGGVPEKTMACV